MPNLNIGRIGGLLRNLGGQALRGFDRDMYGGAMRAGIPLRRAVEGRLGNREIARTLANMRSVQGAGGFLGLGALGSFTGNIENSLNQVGPAIDRVVSNVVPDNIENWAGRTAREMEKGGLMNAAGGLMVAPFVAAQTYGQTGGYNTVQRPLGTKSRLGGKEVSWKGPDLGWQRTYSERIQNQDPQRFGGSTDVQSQSPQRPIGSISTLGGNQVSWQGDDLGWQRTYSGGVSPPSAPAPGSLQSLFSGQQAGQMGSKVIPRGAGVPAQKSNVINRALSQEILNAAQQFNAPANIPLPSFYEGQQQLGRSMMQNGTLVSQLQGLGGAPGMTPENLKIWAEKNPALAYRELLKLKGRAS
jgi:hypothetical protein